MHLIYSRTYTYYENPRNLYHIYLNNRYTNTMARNPGTVAWLQCSIASINSQLGKLVQSPADLTRGKSSGVLHLRALAFPRFAATIPKQ